MAFWSGWSPSCTHRCLPLSSSALSFTQTPGVSFLTPGVGGAVVSFVRPRVQRKTRVLPRHSFHGVRPKHGTSTAERGPGQETEPFHQLLRPCKASPPPSGAGEQPLDPQGNGDIIPVHNSLAGGLGTGRLPAPRAEQGHAGAAARAGVLSPAPRCQSRLEIPWMHAWSNEC